MKFTEEQYQEIIEVWDAKNSYSESTKAVTEMVIRDFNESWKYDIGQALALGNETSRDWAHEQFVEPEKKYVWHIGEAGNIINFINGDWHLDYRLNFDNVQTHFTEREIENSPFIPSWFNKEEVE